MPSEPQPEAQVAETPSAEVPAPVQEAPVVEAPVVEPTAPVAPRKPIGDLDSMAAQYEQMLSAKNAMETPAAQPKMGLAEAVASSAAESVLPSTAGFYGAMKSATFGANLPLPPVGKGAAAVSLGLAGAFGMSWVTEQAQQLAIDHLLPKTWGEAINEEKKQAQKDQPIGSMVGQALPQAALMRPSIGTLKNAASAAKMLMTDSSGAIKYFSTATGSKAFQDLINVSFGAGTQLAVEAGQQAMSGQYDLTKLASAVLIGAALHKETALGKKIAGAAPTITNKFVKEDPKPPTPEEVAAAAATSSPEEMAAKLEAAAIEKERADSLTKADLDSIAALNENSDKIDAKLKKAKDPEKIAELKAQQEELTAQIQGVYDAALAKYRQPEFQFPAYNEKGQGEFGFMGGEGEVIPDAAQPTPPPKTLAFDESGQARFEFFGDLVEAPKAEVDTAAPVRDSAPVAENPAQTQMDFSPLASSVNENKIKATFQGETGFLTLSDDGSTLLLRKPRSKTMFEVGPAGEGGNKPLNQFEGLEIVGQKEKGKAATPAETSAAVIEQENPQPKAKLEEWADKTLSDFVTQSKKMGITPNYRGPNAGAVIGAAAVKGAYFIARGSKQFGVWAGKMIAEFGEGIRPHLADIWSKSQEIHANPAMGAKVLDDTVAANPTPNTDPVAKSQLDAVVDNYINGDATSLVDAANAAGVINLNTFDPRADSTKLVASVANVLEERFAAVKGDVRGMEVKATEAGEWLKSNGMGDVLTSLLNESKVDGAKPDAKIMAYQLLLANANDRLKMAIDNRLVLGTAEADAAAEAAYAHYLKVSMAYKGVGSDAGRTLNALKQSKQWLDTVAFAVNGEKPIEALNKVPLTFGQKAVGALGEMMVNSVLGYKSVGANTIGGAIRSVIDPVEIAIGGLLSGNSAVSRAGGKMLLWHYQNASAAFRSALVAFKSLEPQITPYSKIDEARGGTAKNPNQYGNAVDGVRSRGFLTSETWGLDPKTNPITAPLLDAVGEVYRFSQRMMVTGDEYFKAANAFAMGNAKFYVEGWDKGLRGADLDKYISTNMNTLIDRNGKLYSKENVIKRIAEEVRKEGLTGNEAIQEVLLRSKSEFDANTGEVAKSVREFAEAVSFQEEIPKTDMDGSPTLSNSFYQFFSKHPLFRLGSGMLFIKTPINIFRWTGQHLNGPAIMVGEGLKSVTGKGFPLVERMYLQHQKDLASGDPFKVAQAKGRQAVGAALIGTGSYLAMNGMLTGAGPTNREAKKAMLSTGWIPYSLKINKNTPLGEMIQNVAGGVDSQDADNYYIEFRRMDPIGSHLQLFADFNDIMKSSHLEADSTAQEGLRAAFGAASLSVGNLVQEKSFLTNIKQAMDLLNLSGSDPSTTFQRWNKYIGKRAANTLIPSVISQPLTAEDSQIHEVNNFVQAVAARINGAFGTYAPVQRNVIGEPIDRAITGIAALDIVNPILLSETKNDPVMAELSSLLHGWAPAQRFHSPRGDNEVWDMKDFTNAKGQDAYDRYQELIGEVSVNGVTLRQQLSKLISSKAYKSLPAQQDVLAGQQSGRVDLINRTMGVYKRMALDQIKDEYPDFAKAVKTQQVKALVSKTQDAPTAKKTLNSAMVKNILEFGKPTK